MADALEALLPALRWLDLLLERAIKSAEKVYGPGAAADRFRGLYISNEDAERLLVRTPGEPLFHSIAEEMAAETEPGIVTPGQPASVDRTATPGAEQAAPIGQDQPAPRFFSFIGRRFGRGRKTSTLPPITRQPEVERAVSPLEETPSAETEREEADVSLPPRPGGPPVNASWRPCLPIRVSP